MTNKSSPYFDGFGVEFYDKDGEFRGSYSISAGSLSEAALYVVGSSPEWPSETAKISIERISGFL